MRYRKLGAKGFCGRTVKGDTRKTVSVSGIEVWNRLESS